MAFRGSFVPAENFSAPLGASNKIFGNLLNFPKLGKKCLAIFFLMCRLLTRDSKQVAGVIPALWRWVGGYFQGAPKNWNLNTKLNAILRDICTKRNIFGNLLNLPKSARMLRNTLFLLFQFSMQSLILFHISYRRHCLLLQSSKIDSSSLYFLYLYCKFFMTLSTQVPYWGVII